MLLTSGTIAGVATLLHHLNNNIRSTGFSLLTMFLLILISAFCGSMISFVLIKRILIPISELSKASAKVAKGDFTVRVQTIASVGEIQDLICNFNIMVKELGSIEMLRNDFVVNVSHEFKTPIAAIEGYATLLTDETLSREEHDEYVKMIHKSARQLASLSGNILSLSKLENHDFPWITKPFRLDEQIRQAVLLLEQEWSAKELELEIELERVMYPGNEPLLLQVWTNLMDNAVKFTPVGGNITIKLMTQGEQAMITVADNGIGMSQVVQNHIWNKFYQGDDSHQGEGNGLGLALVKRIVELCGGSISVQSKEDQGSTFLVELPLEEIENTPINSRYNF
jgi:signal transduction histidine kinase